MCVEEEDEDSMASVSSTKANILLIEGSGTEEKDVYFYHPVAHGLVGRWDVTVPVFKGSPTFKSN